MNKKAHWENVYQHKSPDEVSWYQPTPTLSIELMTSCSSSKEVEFIDVGGGASTFVDTLLEKGYTHLTVLDLSATALEKSKQRLADKADLVEWYVDDITEFKAPKRYDVWHDRAVFHFFTEKHEREKYKAVLNESVKSGGHVIVAAFAIGGATKCSGLDVEQYDTRKLENELGENFTLIEQRNENHITPSGNIQLFGYHLFRKK
jgi:SAM-dependent methyltransferase